MILVHGFPALWCAWRFQLPALVAAACRAVAIDHRAGNGTRAGADTQLAGSRVLPGCGHWLQQERAAGTNAVVPESLRALR